ncbi:putative transporter [Exophiala dermatitidis]
MADIKPGTGVVLDHDLLGEKAGVTHEEAMHFGQLTEEERAIEKNLVRKIDARIMPLIVLVYLMNYIDRNNYAAARLQGLEKDLDLKGDEYQLGLSILFVSYILAQVPSNLFLNHLGRPSLYLGFFTTAWGFVSAMTCLVKGFGGIVACRFVLGLVEAPFFPGVLFYLSKWYTKKELNLRMSIFYSGSLVSGAFGSLIAAGILNGLAGKRGLSAWQWLYIIEGTITCAVGLLIMVILPDFPDTWKALPPEMKRVANRRMAIEAAEADVDVAGSSKGMTQVKGMKLAFTDSKTYMLAIAYMCITGAAGFQNFFPTLTATLGYSHTISLLLCAPPYMFMVFYSMAHSVVSDRFGNRFWFFMYPIPITIVGCVVFMTTDSFGPRYFSLFLLIFIFAMNGTCYAWIAGAIPRPPAKRAAAYAFINSIGNSASIWTPFTYRTQDQPHYRLALGICIGLQVVAAIMGLSMRIKLTRQNARLERMENEDVPLSERDLAKLRKTAEIEGIDLAAARRLQKGYRYMI